MGPEVHFQLRRIVFLAKKYKMHNNRLGYAGPPSGGTAVTNVRGLPGPEEGRTGGFGRIAHRQALGNIGGQVGGGKAGGPGLKLFKGPKIF